MGEMGVCMCVCVCSCKCVYVIMHVCSRGELLRLWRPGKAWTIRSCPRDTKINYSVYFFVVIKKKKTQLGFAQDFGLF